MNLLNDHIPLVILKDPDAPKSPELPRVDLVGLAKIDHQDKQTFEVFLKPEVANNATDPWFLVTWKRATRTGLQSIITNGDDCYMVITWKSILWMLGLPPKSKVSHVPRIGKQWAHIPRWKRHLFDWEFETAKKAIQAWIDKTGV